MNSVGPDTQELGLEEAKRIVNLAERATYLLAYNAMLKDVTPISK